VDWVKEKGRRLGKSERVWGEQNNRKEKSFLSENKSRGRSEKSGGR